MSAHDQAMSLVREGRSLRDRVRSLPWHELRPLDLRRLARAVEALESDLLLSRILLRAAAARHEGPVRRPVRRPSREPEYEEGDGV